MKLCSFRLLRVWEEAMLSANPEACTEAAHKACPAGCGQRDHPHAYHTPAQDGHSNLLGLESQSKAHLPPACRASLGREGGSEQGVLLTYITSFLGVLQVRGPCWGQVTAQL